MFDNIYSKKSGAFAADMFKTSLITFSFAPITVLAMTLMLSALA